nr:glutathione peroxidase 1 [Litchi chinensis]
MVSSSMPFSATFSAFTQTKKTPVFCFSSWSSMASSAACSMKSSLGFSKSAFLRDGFVLQSATLPGIFSKARSFNGVYARAATEKSIHDFTVKDIEGKDVPLNKFKGKALLIVNVASRCGLTTANYSELSHIYEKYKTQGEPYA